MSLVVARWGRLSLVTAGAVLALTWPLAGVAGAHAALEETVPADDDVLDASPGDVALRFSEPVEVSEEASRSLGQTVSLWTSGRPPRTTMGSSSPPSSMLAFGARTA